MGEEVASTRRASADFFVGNRRASADISLVRHRPTLTNRMSRIGTLALEEFISGIRKGAANKGSLSQLNLDGRLEKFGMQMKTMDGDGNCQFRAFAYNLFGAQSHHACIRRAAVAHM